MLLNIQGKFLVKDGVPLSDDSGLFFGLFLRIWQEVELKVGREGGRGEGGREGGRSAGGREGGRRNVYFSGFISFLFLLQLFL